MVFRTTQHQPDHDAYSFLKAECPVLAKYAKEAYFVESAHSPEDVGYLACNKGGLKRATSARHAQPEFLVIKLAGTRDDHPTPELTQQIMSELDKVLARTGINESMPPACVDWAADRWEMQQQDHADECEIFGAELTSRCHARMKYKATQGECSIVYHINAIAPKLADTLIDFLHHEIALNKASGRVR